MKQIVFSGLDCAGKSTQINLLEDYLRSLGLKPIYLWSRGGYTSGFNALKSFLRKISGKAIPAPGRSKQREKSLGRPVVRKLWQTLAILDLIRVYGIQIRLWKLIGRTVVCDRYLADTLIDFKLNFPDDNVAGTFFWNILVWVAPHPDVTFALLIPVEESLKRSARKDEPFPDSPSVLEARLMLYSEMAKDNPWVVVDGREPVEAVWAKIKATITG